MMATSVAASRSSRMIAAWVVTFAVVAGYALWVLARGRRLSREVAPEERRWMTAGSRGRE